MKIGDEHKERVWELPGSYVEPEKTRHSEQMPEDLSTERNVHEGKQSPGANKSTPESSQLFSPDQATSFRSRWDTIQTGFVDEPQGAVKQADGLVTEVINRLTQVFSDERAKLEVKFDQTQKGEPSTEDLRLALQRYRSFFGRLLAM